jgi:arsenite oxidase small subunit
MAALGALQSFRGAGRLGTPVAEAQFRSARVELRWEGRGPLRTADLVPHKDYIFAYPYETTPCFLLDLGRPLLEAPMSLPAGGGYNWPGGVGPKRSVVAYSAICPHTYTHPTRDTAMIHYFPPNKPATVAQRGEVITCCVHGSAFDPGHGAIPLQPPAEVPLATIVLEWDATTDGLQAIAILGRNVINEFYQSFPRKGRNEVGNYTEVSELSSYSTSVLPC